MKRVRFGMVWQCYGHQEVELPEYIDVNDEQALKEYLERIWDDIPLPEGDYVSGSDELDCEFIEAYESEI